MSDTKIAPPPSARLQLTSIITLIWWVLWGGVVVLLSLMPALNGVRVNIPHGQYLFFAITVIATILIVFLVSRPAVSQGFGNRHWLLFGVVFIALLPSAAHSLPSLRLLAIIIITTLPFILLGRLFVAADPQRFLMPLFLVSLFCAAGTLFLQWYGPINIGPVNFFNYLHGLRWSFLFLEANDLGMMSAIGIATGLYFLVVAGSSPVKLLLISVLLVFLLFIFLKTNSRASFFWVAWALGLFLCAGIYGVYEKFGRPQHFWKAGAFLGICILTTLYILMADDLHSFLRMNQGDITSGRMHIWQLYWEQIKVHPWFGMGFGSTAEFLKEERVGSPLNVYVGVLGESGVVGFLPLIFLWLSAVAIAVRVVLTEWRNDKNRAFLALWILMMLGGIALQQNGEWSIMRVSPLHYLFFFVLAAAWSLRGTNGQSFPSSRSPV